MILEWLFLDYNELSKQQLHKILIFRQEIFVVEQNCPYLDADEKDRFSHHLLGLKNHGQLVAYLRLVHAGISYPEISFGRIATHISFRSQGLGKRLMKEGLTRTEQMFGKNPIRISAQTHLVSFYTFFGFVSTGKNYLEDGIPHTEMLRKI